MQDTIILINSQFLGKGDETLGEALLENFFTHLKQNKEMPRALFFINSGVFALTNQSLASLHIKELYNKGIPILACKTCVDYYGIENELTSGDISSMSELIDLAKQYKVITL